MEDYLMHHGVLGQKWGVRRYQNADGSLTTAGKLRAAKGQVKEGTLSKDEYGAVKKYAKAKRASEKAEYQESQYHKNHMMGNVINSDSYRKKQAKQEYKYDKKYQNLEKDSKKVVDKIVKDIGKTSISSLNKDTIDIGRAIMQGQFMTTIIAGAPIGLAVSIGAQYGASHSKKVKALDEGTHATQYDRRGRLTTIK